MPTLKELGISSETYILLVYGHNIAIILIKFMGLAITLCLYFMECDELRLPNKIIFILGDNTSTILWVSQSSLPKGPHILC